MSKIKYRKDTGTSRISFRRNKALSLCQFFYCCKLYADAEDIHSLFKLMNRRICWSKTDIAVLGVFAVGIGSACACEHNACFLAE